MIHSTFTLCSVLLRLRSMPLTCQLRSATLRDQVHMLIHSDSEPMVTTQQMMLLKRMRSMLTFQNAEPTLVKMGRWLPSQRNALSLESSNLERLQTSLSFSITSMEHRNLSSSSRNLALCVETTSNLSQCQVNSSLALTKTSK